MVVEEEEEEEQQENERGSERARETVRAPRELLQ